MDIIHVAFLNIIQLRLYALHISCKIINIKHHAEHIVLFIPIRLFFPFFVQSFQIFAAFLIKSFHLIAQFCKHGTVVVQFHIQPAQLIKMPFKPFLINFLYSVRLHVLFLLQKYYVRILCIWNLYAAAKPSAVLQATLHWVFMLRP